MTGYTKALQERIHELNAKWWHDKEGNRLDRNRGELICLFHSEVSEASEGTLLNAMDDKLPHRRMEEVEMADTQIRILDYAEGFGYDLGNSIPIFVTGSHQFFHSDATNLEAKLAQHAIIHMHLSKAMECERKGRFGETDGWLAGALHLIGVYCLTHDLDLNGAMEEKLAFNTVRPDHQYDAREKADGKKW